MYLQHHPGKFIGKCRDDYNISLECILFTYITNYIPKLTKPKGIKLKILFSFRRKKKENQFLNKLYKLNFIIIWQLEMITLSSMHLMILFYENRL